MSLFAQLDAAGLPEPCPGGVGLTTALVVLRAGWVVVGSMPTAEGTAATAQAGCLIVLDSSGTPVETFSGAPINGPWDMTAADHGTEASLLFTNVLNGTAAENGQVVRQGSVVRIDLSLSPRQMPRMDAITTIASGFPEHTDPAALVISPTGLVLRHGCERDEAGHCIRDDRPPEAMLYVADTLGNRIAVIRGPLDRTTPAGTGETLMAGGTLNGPLGLGPVSF